jgi:DNA repair exonuclease SbcCD ATPase subunit
VTSTDLDIDRIAQAVIQGEAAADEHGARLAQAYLALRAERASSSRAPTPQGDELQGLIHDNSMRDDLSASASQGVVGEPELPRHPWLLEIERLKSQVTQLTTALQEATREKAQEERVVVMWRDQYHDAADALEASQQAQETLQRDIAELCHLVQPGDSIQHVTLADYRQALGDQCVIRVDEAEDDTMKAEAALATLQQGIRRLIEDWRSTARVAGQYSVEGATHAHDHHSAASEAMTAWQCAEQLEALMAPSPVEPPT